MPVTSGAPGKRRMSAGSGQPERAKANISKVKAKAPTDLDASKLPLRQQVFLDEYLIDLNGTQAAIRAGYAATDARTRASRLLAKPNLKEIVQARIDEKIEAIRMSRERVLDAFADIAEADANELSQHRRVCCRHCHGPIDKATGGRDKLYTPAEWIERRERHEARRQELIAGGRGDIGEFAVPTPQRWYDKRLPINSDCPECFGDGVGEVFLMDTRMISRRARALLAGVRETRDGVEIKVHSKEAALSVLAKHHKIYDDAPTVAVSFNAVELDATFGEAMRKSTERMEQMRRDRRAAREARFDLQIGFAAQQSTVVGVVVHEGSK